MEERDEGNGAAAPAEPGPTNDIDAQEEETPPRITLDRYLSKRRAPPRSGIYQIIAAVAMALTLVMVVLYKDRCGEAVSGLIGELDPPAQPAGQPVRIELKGSEQRD